MAISSLSSIFRMNVILFDSGSFEFESPSKRKIPASRKSLRYPDPPPSATDGYGNMLLRALSVNYNSSIMY